MKTTRRFPCGRYDTAGLERWLGELAEKGLLLKELLNGRGVFDPCEPHTCRYCMEPRRREEQFDPDQETRELYAAAGWEFVCGDAAGDLWVWRSLRPDAAPLHSDPVAESFGYRRLLRRCQNRQIGLFALGAGGCVLLFWGAIPRCADAPVLALLRRNDLAAQWLWWLFLLGLCICPFISDISEYRALRRLVRSLAAGVRPAPRRGRFSPRTQTALLWAGAAVYLAAVFALTLAGRDRQSYTGALADCPTALPYVSIETLGGAATEEDYASWGKSTLARAWYATGEGERYHYVFSNGYGSSHVYTTTLYDLRLPFLQRELVRELRETEPRQEAGAAWTPLRDGRFDEAWYGTDPLGVQYLCLCRSGRVLYLECKLPVELRGELGRYSALLDGLEGA